jgi:hypothetical protein
MMQSKARPQSVAEGPSSSKFLTELEMFNTVKASIMEVIDNSFNLAAAYAKHFNDFKSVFLFGREWSINNYKAQNYPKEQFAADLAKFTKWANDMDRWRCASFFLFFFFSELTPLIAKNPNVCHEGYFVHRFQGSERKPGTNSLQGSGRLENAVGFAGLHSNLQSAGLVPQLYQLTVLRTSHSGRVRAS